MNNHDRIAASSQFRALERHEPEGSGVDLYLTRADIRHVLWIMLLLLALGVAFAGWFGGSGVALIVLVILGLMIVPPAMLVWIRWRAHSHTIDSASHELIALRLARVRAVRIGRQRRIDPSRQDATAQARQDDDGGPPQHAAPAGVRAQSP